MFSIVEARSVARGIKLFVIKAPRIARKQKPGQFVIVRLDDSGERIPLTIADSDAEAGTVTIVVQAIGKTTMLLSMLEAGDSILDVVGPLGKPSEIENFGFDRQWSSAAVLGRLWPIQPPASSSELATRSSRS